MPEQGHNKLIHESSPYLLQHAHNPVHWYPWGEEALTLARQSDKPIFLSIGYSTCHWCHVMEQESFTDQEIADILHRYFISIKVDREQRPDIDHTYMLACQLFTGAGGWPLSAFLTPDARPFYAGTYFPPRARYNRPGFKDLLLLIADKWQTDRQRLTSAADQMTDMIQTHLVPAHPGPINPDIFTQAVDLLSQQFDARYGGFGTAPKFPVPSRLLFLNRQSATDQVLNMITTTLAGMYRGGLFDHIGSGFARYSTDDKWLIPHFEKMLYDNALLAIAYAEGYHVTKHQLFMSVAHRTLNYISTELSHDQGGFYSAQDADSEGVEGRFYVWTPDQILTALGRDGERWCELFGITRGGNFEGKNVPNLLGSPVPDLLSGWVLSDPELEDMRRALYKVRSQRVPPLTDDKILTGWNGLAIAAFAIVGRLSGENRYVQRAESAAEFIDNNLRHNDRLHTSWRDGKLGVSAFLPDYAYLSWGYLELYRSTLQVKYAAKAVQLADELLGLFYDDGNLYFTAADSEQLLGRAVEIQDGALPSGVSIAVHVLVELSRLTGSELYAERAQSVIESIGGLITSDPTAFSALLIPLSLIMEPGPDLVIAGRRSDQQTDKLLGVATAGFRPLLSLSLRTDEPDYDIGHLSPTAAGFSLDQSAAYLCKNSTCLAPINDPDLLRDQLANISASEPQEPGNHPPDHI